MPAWARWSLRLLVSVSLLALLAWVVDWSRLLDAVAALPGWLWSVGLVAFVGGHAVAAIKWHLLLGPDALPRSTAVRTHFTGLAANLLLPGLAGGDLVRAGAVGRAAGRWEAVALAGVVDRLLDSVALVLLAAAGFAWTAAPSTSTLRVLGATAAVLLVGAVAAAVVATWMARGVAGWQRRLAAALHRLRATPGRTAAAAAISLSVQALFVVIAAALGHAVGVRAAPSTWMVVWPLAKLVAVLPVSLAGIGFREAALIVLFRPYGIDEALVLATGLAWESILVVGALAGGAVAWTMRRREPRRVGGGHV